MKAIAERDAMIERLRECLNREEVSFAFLFGSWARGEVFRESDADVAIYLQGDYTVDKIKGIWRRLEAAARKDVDLLVLNRASPLTAYEAIRGEPLVMKDRKLFIDYMLQVSTEAEDLRTFTLDLWRWRESTRRKR